jgi:glycosyltransferase involved in cell wall biosynthesis
VLPSGRVKLIVQIPCLNEEGTLPETLAAIPRSVPGVDVVEVLVIDDGSTDRTAEVARAHGADHVVRFTRRKGLAAGFMAGLDACLRLGADVIVNTDADHQYPGHEIPRLIAPILSGEADMVVGDRGVGGVRHFSWTKRRLQTLGSWVVRKVSGTTVADATSGFRALNREAALRINIVSEFTYTLESIIQAGKKKMAVAHLPIEARQTRPSRLFGSTWEYIKRSGATILRIYAMYEPLKVFVILGSLLLTGGFILGARYAYFWAVENRAAGHVQSGILSVLLLILGFQTLQWGIMADLVASNRKLLEDILYRVRKGELDAARQEDGTPRLPRELEDRAPRG